MIRYFCLQPGHCGYSGRGRGAGLGVEPARSSAPIGSLYSQTPSVYSRKPPKSDQEKPEEILGQIQRPSTESERVGESFNANSRAADPCLSK
jgi:hypothetical protein